MKKFLSNLNSFIYRNGLDNAKVFDDLLRYIIIGFTRPGAEGLKDWRYTKEQNAEFFQLFQELLQVVKREININGWYDAFGTIYEELIASKSKRSNTGQFFTPSSLCNLMAEIVYGKEEKICGKVINDCAVGSGRTLLAFHIRHLGNYYVAEDIDPMCVKMTVCNFLLHGVEGEVICYDTLCCPDSCVFAYKVNEGLNNPLSKYYHVPNIQEIDFKQTILHRQNEQRKIINIKKKMQESADKHLQVFRDIMRKSNKTDKEKEQARQEINKYKQIKRAIENYGKEKRR